MELVPEPAEEPVEVFEALEVEELAERWPGDQPMDEPVEAFEVEQVVEVVEVVEVGEPVGPDEPALDRTLGETYEELLAAAEQVLDEVDGALVRLRDGTYGTCGVCGDAIADDRLAEVPTARTCERHLPLAEAG